MNNEDKKKFIINVHKEFMSARPYDDSFSIERMKEKEELFWKRYESLFCEKLPQKLYKYRKCSEQNIKAFEDDFAWFSTPSEFGDIVDSTLNTDIESELEEIEKNPAPHIKRISTAIINVMLAPYGQSLDENMLDSVLPLFNENGEVKEEDAKKLLGEKLPEYASDQYAKQLVNSTQLSNQEPILESVKGFLNLYLEFNKKIRNETYVYCMAEENDNLAMWETYADSASGFCIEYKFDKGTFLGQKMLLNLFPIYYGEKEQIKFFDVLVRGLEAKQKINGISYDDYAKWFLSAYTKDPTYSFQKEWRIGFTKEMGGCKQSFPFASSIILGEKITDDNKNKLVDIAKRKGIKVYQRKLNISGSKIILKEI